MTILLISGLTLEKPSSFSRQLTILQSAMKDLGIHALLTGPSLEGVNMSGMTIDAALLLGYADQFNLLRQRASQRFPLYLWAQFSRPPDSGSLSQFIPVPLTAQTAQFIRESGLRHMYPVIPHGIDLSLYRPLGREEKRDCRAAHNLRGDLVIGTVGAHTRRKRLDLVIKSFSHLRTRGLNSDLVIKTDRVRSLEGEDLEKLAGQCGVLQNTHLITGEMNAAEMSPLYGCMDIYLNLSEWEGFCIPIVEALACGIPVSCPPLQGPGEIVPYDRLYIQDYVQFNEEGALLCEANPEAAAKVILNAVSNPDMLEELAEAGMHEARKHFDIVEVARRWIELFKGRT
jgi:glycosyltransferase involved in cell wall biosynthesis